MREPEAKTRLLASLSEGQLRVQILVPLLIRMGLEHVKEYHGGVSEKGKDIVGRYTDMLGSRHYVAIVVKRGNIHGAVGKRGSASEVLFQVEQALSEPFSDVYDLEPVDISECWVITSGLVKNTSIESIREKLRKSNLDKVTRFIDQQRLAALIDQHWPDYWMHDRIMIAIAHELQAPIVAAKLSARFIADSPRRLSEEQVRNHALRISSEMDHLSRLVEYVSYASRRRVQLHVRKIDTQSAVRQVLRHSRITQSVKTDFKKLPSLKVDQRAFEQCIFNLAKNASQYSPKSGSEILIMGEVVEDRAIIRVRDWGIGVPDGWEDQIFEEGVRAPNAAVESGPGAGLGLCVTRRLVEQHGGKVLLTSKADPTEFTMYLPLGEVDENTLAR